MAGVDEYVKLLVHCDGTDGSTTFTDASGNEHTVSAAGHAQVDTAQKKFGTGSLLLDGNTDDSLYVADNDDFSFGTGEFTIDFWVCLNSGISAWTGVVGKFILGSGANEYQWTWQNSTAMQWWAGGADGNGATGAGAWTIDACTTGTWYHFALVRSGNSYTLYQNGVSKGTKTASLVYANTTTRLEIGRVADGSTKSIPGQIDEFRLSKGIARWTEDFTPPTEAYSSQSASPSISVSLSPSLSSSLSFSASPSLSESLSLSPSPSVSESASKSPSPSASISASPSLSESASPSLSQSPSPSVSVSASPSISESASISPSPSVSESLSRSLSPSVSVSLSGSPSPSVSVSASPSISVSASPSLSPSLSESASPSPSPSVSVSLSPSVSESASKSFSPSTSVSASPSISESVSISPSPSVSESLSKSLSPSVSVSASPSVSESVSLSPSPSVSVSLSPSPSPSEGYQLYTKGNYAALPADNSDLEDQYSAGDITNVATKDDVRVGQIANQEYMIHQYKDFVGDHVDCVLEWEGQTSLAPALSTVYLQIYKQNTLEWQTVDSDNASNANTDFTLTAIIADLTNYKDAQNIITSRIYQLAI